MSPQRGFTMIEVLVALVVLSIGLLGAAKLQVLAVRYNSQSFLRGQAVVLAYDMADRMRANPTAVAAGNYDSADGANFQAAADNGCSRDQRRGGGRVYLRRIGRPRCAGMVELDKRAAAGWRRHRVS